ncbi:hypothetical protein QE152_g14322 [Popillia japonica]|uniref:Uncharacterized protein n=1 Tax=Popillia japonica TaxID=7064 RepID=A0AAW1L9X5_POPJA
MYPFSGETKKKEKDVGVATLGSNAAGIDALLSNTAPTPTADRSRQAVRRMRDTAADVQLFRAILFG